MTPVQLRMARAALQWSLDDLASRSGMSADEIANLEKEKVAGPREAVERVRSVLEDAGVEFLDDGAPGVRLRPHAGFIPTEDLNAENDG